MATQKCPKCGSKRIRPGYRTTSIFMKLIFRYNLLCNNCNWEFVGFAIPGTLSNKAKNKKKYPDPNFRRPEDIENKEIDKLQTGLNLKEGNLVNTTPQKIKVRKRVKVRF